jgi:hypothetical protein
VGRSYAPPGLGIGGNNSTPGLRRGAIVFCPLRGLLEREKFWQDRYYDSNVYGEQARAEVIRYIHRNPVARGLVAKPEDCHPADEDLSVGTPVAVVQFPALRDRNEGDSRDRIAVDRLPARKSVARRSAARGRRTFVLPPPKPQKARLGWGTIHRGRTRGEKWPDHQPFAILWNALIWD